MTKKEYKEEERNLILFGWVLLAEAVLAFGFWIFIINHLKK